MTSRLKLGLFTQMADNLPQTYPWEGTQVETNAGIAFCQPFAAERQANVHTIVIAYKDAQSNPDAGYSVAWEADIVAVCRSAPPFDTWGGSPRYDIFYANSRRLTVVPKRAPGPGYIRYLD